MLMVAVCDILGFSNFIQRNSSDFVVNDRLGFLRRALHHSMHQNGFPDEIPTLSTLLQQNRVGFAWFSDTLLFYGIDESDESKGINGNTVCPAFLFQGCTPDLNILMRWQSYCRGPFCSGGTFPDSCV